MILNRESMKSFVLLLLLVYVFLPKWVNMLINVVIFGLKVQV